MVSFKQKVVLILSHNELHCFSSALGNVDLLVNISPYDCTKTTLGLTIRTDIAPTGFPHYCEYLLNNFAQNRKQIKKTGIISRELLPASI